MSKNTIAHNINKTPRTEDVAMHENIDFAGLLLSEDLLTGLTCAGFQRPSPIQLKAIPMGRCGLDLIVQAKSGTGKTCVFAVIALESITLKSNLTQVLVLAPTREIAVQIWEVINSIGSNMTELRCYTFIGGLPIDEDKKKLKKCHIAVGTPGRIKQLLEEKLLCPDSLRLFVLDEADKLLEDSFKDTVNWIYSVLPQNKQMLALSATYPESLALHLTSYMRNPTFIRLNSSDPALLGIRQYYLRVPFHPIPQMVFDNKTKALLRLLSSITFSQCLVFSNYQTRAQSLCNQLTSKGWPTTFINGAQNQQHRLTAMAKLKKYKCRVLVTTDLTARGIDAENVNLVINLDVPKDHETYLHRIGRAGRFGTYGAGITLCCEGLESDQLCDIQDKCCTDILMLPDPIPTDLAKASGFVNLDHLITTEQLSEHHPKPSENENQPELAQKDVDGRLKRTSNGNTKSKSDFERSSKKSNEETSGSVAHAQAEEYSVHNVQNIGIQNTNIAVNSPKQAFKNMPSIEKRAQSFLTFEKIKEAQERKTEIVIFPESHFDSPNLSAVAKMLNDLHFEQQVSASKMTNSKEPKALKHDQIINESYETKNDGVASQIRNGVKVKSYKVRNSNRLHKEDISLGMEYVDMLGSKDIQSESESETGSDSCNDNSESESCPQREEESDFISIKERKKSSRIRNISHRSQEVIEQDNYVYADDEREDENVSSYPNIAWTTVDKGNSNANLPVEEYADDQGDAQNSVNRSDMFKKYFDDYDENCQNQLYLHVEADKLSESCPQREEESDFLELDHRKRVSSRKQNAPRRHHRSGAEKYAYADDEREDSAEVEKEKTKFVEMETQKIESSDEESEESHKEKMTYPSYNPFDPRIPNYPRSEQDMYQSVWGRSYMQQWTSMYQSYLYQQYILYSHQAEYFKQLYQQSKQSQNLCEIYKKQKSYMDYMVRKTMKKR